MLEWQPRKIGPYDQQRSTGVLEDASDAVRQPAGNAVAILRKERPIADELT